MPAPQLHLTFGNLISTHVGVPTQMQRACSREPVYTRLGAIVHDLPYYGNMIVEAMRYGLRGAALDEPWSYRMHSVTPARFIASYIRAAATTPGLSRDEGLALSAGILSHAALDLTLHPLVNYCARRDVARFGGHESVHHRVTEKYHALFFHYDRFGHDLFGTRAFAQSTRVVKSGSLAFAHVELPIARMVSSAYTGAYGDAPPIGKWSAWVRNFAHFGLLVGHRATAHNSRKMNKPELRARYFDNDVFAFFEFYAASERRLSELTQLGYAYFDAGDFSKDAEDAFVLASRIDDLAEPTVQAIDRLPPLPTLSVLSTPGGSVPLSALADVSTHRTRKRFGVRFAAKVARPFRVLTQRA